MNRQVKQILALSAFALGCTALGMGLSHHYVAQAQEDRPVSVDPKGIAALPPIAEVAEKLNPTVVFISNTSFVKQRRAAGSPFGSEFFDFFYGPNRPRGMQSEPEEQKVQGFGSGVVISADGEILTNYHVIEGARGGEVKLEVKLSDGKEYKATVLGKDKDLDLALIKIDASHLPHARLGDSDAARVGEWVVAIGNPLGLQHTVTQGIISAKGRNASEVGGRSPVESYLQTDAAINRGNSGGPLLNLRGEVIGINTAINPYGQNIGFAVPINSAKRILADLRAGKPVRRGYLGVTPVDLDRGFQESLGVKQGVVVGEVMAGAPADKAGIQRLDVITTLEGSPVKDPEDLIQLVGGRRAGEKVKLGFVRDGKGLEVVVTLGERPTAGGAQGEEAEESPARPESEGTLDLKKSYGFGVEALTAANRHQYAIGEEKKGVVVTEVVGRSEAADKLIPGALITAVGTRPVSNLQEFREAVKRVDRKALILQVAFQNQGRWISRTVAIPVR